MPDTDFELTCAWLDTCERPAIGMAAHPIHGVIPICGTCRTNFDIPLIKPRKAS